MAENFIKGFQTDKGVGLYDYNALGNLPTLITQEQLEAVQAAANKYTDDEIAKLDLGGAETTPTNPFNIATIISTGQDFSELTKSGIYQIYKAAAENSQNCPTTNGGILTVKARQNETNPILQYMVDTTGKTYTRYKTSTSWSTWKEYVITGSLSEYTKKNELEAQVEQSLFEALEQVKQDGTFKGEPGNDYVLTEVDKNEIAAIAADLINIPESNDWNAAEGEPGHILNRPFYDDRVILLNETYTNNGYAHSFEGGIGLVVGEQYDVVFNGVKHTCTAEAFWDGGYTVNALLIGQSSDPDYVEILDYPAGLTSPNAAAVTLVYCNDKSITEVAISIKKGELKKIDEKYLPDNYSGGNDSRLEPLIGTTKDLTPEQVAIAVATGRDVVLSYTDTNFGEIYFTGFLIVPILGAVAASGINEYDEKPMRFSLVGLIIDNMWHFTYNQLADIGDVPTKLPNPNALIFTGAVTGSYDGSSPLTINIPAGGSGDSNGSDNTGDTDGEMFVGTTPVKLSKSGTIRLVCDSACDYEITSDTVAVADIMSGSVTKATLEKVDEHYQLKHVAGTTAWYQSFVNIPITGLTPGQAYNFIFDASGMPYDASNNITCGHWILKDGSGNTLLTKLGTNGNVKHVHAFTATTENLVLAWYPLSGNEYASGEIGTANVKAIYVNRAETTALTDVVNRNGTFNDSVTLHAIPAGVTITADPACEVYLLTDEATRPESLKPLFGKNVVCFGDSLFGMERGDDSATAFIAEETGANVYNVGFGGCRMSVHHSSGYAEFSMWALAKSIAEDNWSVQDSAASKGLSYFPEQLALLKSIDFSTVDIVVIHYGTNDFDAGNVIAMDNPADHDDYTTLCGALRYSIEKLLGTYPKLRIYVSLPVYRYWTDNGVNTYAETYLNVGGKTLLEFVEALRSTAAEYNLPVIDGYYGLGINKTNATTFLFDGTHHNTAGRERFGRYIGQNLISQQTTGKIGVDLTDYTTKKWVTNLISGGKNNVFYTNIEPTTDDWIFMNYEIETNDASILPGNLIITPSGKTYSVTIVEDYRIEATIISYALKSDILTNQQIIDLITATFTNVSKEGA